MVTRCRPGGGGKHGVGVRTCRKTLSSFRSPSSSALPSAYARSAAAAAFGSPTRAACAGAGGVSAVLVGGVVGEWAGGVGVGISKGSEEGAAS